MFTVSWTSLCVFLLLLLAGLLLTSIQQAAGGPEHGRYKRSVEALVQSEVRARDRHSLFLDQFLPPDHSDWDWTSAPRLVDVGEQDATLPLQDSHALLPSPRAPRTRFSRAAPTPAPGTNLTLLMKQMKDYVEDNMINKDPLFDEKFTEMLEAALGNATESEHREQRELARTLLQAWKVHLRQDSEVRASTSRSREVREECRNPPKILANDSLESVRQKQGHRMQCYMNTEVEPCDDFYEYACGNWAQYFPIPKDRGGFDTFEILREDLDTKLRQLLEAPVTQEDTNSTSAVKMLYSSCMNTGRIEERAAGPLLTLLEEMGGWPVLDEDWSQEGFDWVEVVGKLRLYNNDILVSLWVGPDGKNSDHYIVQFDQSDLVLPSTEYYQQGIDHPIMKAYQAILTNVASLLGAEASRASRDMREVILFEIELAGIMTPPHERRNFSQIYEKLPLSALSARVPEFNFTQYLDIVLPEGLQPEEEVVIYASKYFLKLTKIVADTPPRVLANYILMRFIRHRINNLDTRFEAIQNELYRLLYGREEMPARWKFCIAYVNGNLGMSVGSLFVREYFDQQSKQDMLYLTGEIQAQFRALVEEVDWLSETTKETARNKLGAMIHNIGYPDLVLSDEQLGAEIQGLEYSEEEFFENVLTNLHGRTVREMSMLGQTVNRSIWTTTPAVVNAYYSRNRNQIMFPAGILQPPFYHKYFPKALNFGGIGVVIGHEITHGFDDKGKQFDEQGNIQQWWDTASSDSFREKAMCIINQYSQFLVSEVGAALNGLNTQGENIADNGGIKQAYRAYSKWSTEQGPEPPLPGLPDLTPEQLFFLNFAQVWCGTSRPEALQSKLKTAVHAPGKYRVLGTVANSVEFSTAFQCGAEQAMNPREKCKVW